MATCDLTAGHLRELFDYNSETGLFTRKISVATNAVAGAVAGSISVKGYTYIGINRKLYKASRLAWLYVHGCWPKHHIDHIDGNKTNDRISNLREATNSENMQNITRPKSSNLHGYLGAHYVRGRWQSRITKNGITHNLGMFDTPEEAHSAYIAAKRVMHPFAML